MNRPTPALSPQILEEASDWFVEFSEGNPDTATRQRFDTWLRRSPEHVQAYLKISALWEDAPRLQKGCTLAPEELIARVLGEANVVTLDRSTTSALPRAVNEQQQTSAALVPAPPLLPARSRRKWLATAASIFVAAAGLSTYLYIQDDTYSTRIGEQRSIRLDDGSLIELNSRSSVRIRYSDRERHIDLIQGQALFRVAHDTTRPFIVDADDTYVRAVGTQFDVYRRMTGTTVTVLEGKVVVASSNVVLDSKAAPAERDTQQASSRERGSGASKPATRRVVRPSPSSPHVFLSAGEQLTVTRAAITAPVPADVDIATAWTQHKIAFRGAPLSEVVEEFNRYNERQMHIDPDSDLATTRISGTFSSTEPDPLLRFLRDLPNFDVQETAREIRIARQRPATQ